MRLLIKKYLMFTCLFLTFSVAFANPKFKTLVPNILMIGTSFKNPPFEFLNDNRQVGIEIDIITEIAKRLNLTPKFVSTEREVIFDQLSNNHFDVIMDAIPVTPKRNNMVTFSKPYMNTTLGIAFNKKQSPQLKKLSDLHDQIIGVAAHTKTYDVAVNMQKQGIVKKVRIYLFKNFHQAIDDLLAGKIGAIMMVYPAIYYYVQSNPSLKILTSLPNNPQPLGFGVNKIDVGLVEAINQAQTEMQRDGTYRRILIKWFDHSKEKITSTPDQI